MLYAGIKNLSQSQNVLNLEEFSISVLEILMVLEREEYLKGAPGEKAKRGKKKKVNNIEKIVITFGLFNYRF